MPDVQFNTSTAKRFTRILDAYAAEIPSRARRVDRQEATKGATSGS